MQTVSKKKKNKKAGVAKLIPFKIDKTKSISRVKKETFYDKSDRCNDYIHMYLKKPLQIQEAKSDRREGGHRKFNNNI